MPIPVLDYGRPKRVAEVQGSQISRELAHEGGNVVNSTNRPPLPPGNIPGTHFCWSLNRPQEHNVAGMIVNEKLVSISIQEFGCIIVLIL
jgi:hypothetical protein